MPPSAQALGGLGHKPARIGGIRPLTEALVAGARWDAVFNICEGLKGVAREAQVPALLEAFDIPYVFSDPLTLALALDKAMAKRVVRDAGVPTADFAVIESEADIAQVAIAFPLFLKPVAEGSGKGVDARSRVDGSRRRWTSVARDLLATVSPAGAGGGISARPRIHRRHHRHRRRAPGCWAVIEIVPGEKYRRPWLWL